MWKQPVLFLGFFFAFLQVAFVNAQERQYRADNSIKVYNGTKAVTMAWCGGLNNPQFAMADLNRDGKNDLVIFEQSTGILTFLNSGLPGSPVYIYTPDYETYFPAINQYLKLVDYNNDGVADLVHRGSAGFSIYSGYYGDDDRLRFRYYKELHYQTATGAWVNAYCEPNDIPDIVDVDHDGDLDFFSYSIGGGYISLYKNCRVEEGLPADSIKICLSDNCWGKTYQPFERTHDLGISCSTWGTTCKGCDNKQNKTTHAGNSLCLVDFDGDGDYDYFNGNNDFREIQYLTNGKVDYGQSIDSMILQDTAWSHDGATINNMQWPSAFWLDIDGDADKDLLFSPHTQGSDNYRCISYYRNNGSANIPVYRYQSDSFLMDEVIDLGSGAYPMLYDYNRDGKPDLFIGSQGYYEAGSAALRSRISYYENTSAGNEISFQLRSKDFLNISALNISGAALAAGDLDRDGSDDLVIGRTDGTLLYFRNNAPADEVPDWQYVGVLTNAAGTEINAGGFAAPLVYDMDGDGFSDLILGNRLGTLVYYRNIGMRNVQPLLQLENDELGGVKTASAFAAFGYSVPFIGKLDDKRKDYLLLGSQSGALYRYDGFQSGDVSGDFTKLDSFYQQIAAPPYSAPVVADFDNDGAYEIIIGTIAGGLKLYRLKEPINDDDGHGRADGYSIKIYPNPATTNELTITWTPNFLDGDISIALFSASGQRVLHHTHQSSDYFARFDLSALHSGVYYCIIISGKNRFTAPVVLVRP